MRTSAPFAVGNDGLFDYLLDLRRLTSNIKRANVKYSSQIDYFLMDNYNKRVNTFIA